MSAPRSVFARWVLACAAAEAVGMTAAAGAAKWVQALSDHPGAAGSAAVALALVVAGGLVEGTALGTAQGTVLARRWPRLRRGRFVTITVVLAGLGWAAGSAPGVLSGDDSASEPPLLLVLAGGAAIGLVMGPVLGAGQALVLRGVVRYPWRWVAANAVAWPATMVVIFLGAGTPDSGWSPLTVMGVGTVTGAVAGTLLGLLSGAWLASLDGQPVSNRFVLAALRLRRATVPDRGLIGLGVRGRRTGRTVRFPVQCAQAGDRFVVVPGHAATKTWWRNLQDPDTPVEVLLRGHWESASARLLRPGAPGYAESLAAYHHSLPHTRIDPGQPVVVLTPRSPAGNARVPVGVDP